MKRFIKIFSVILLATAAILVAVLLIKARRPEPLVLAELRLKGYETNSSQQKVAVFELKNPGRIPVDYYMYEDIAGKIQNTPSTGALGGHSTNLMSMALSDRPTRLMLNCKSRHTLRDLGHEILGVIGKRPAGVAEYALFWDLTP